ncbi:carboxypeptidase regulatory-like domain-containing protein [Flavobacterium sp. IMCC34852]|uniref:Carboxypeptidase regulatory-like domain-containing protein n=1 Tax=Flavobacterium rivulicola TaxID=2732161 RepID=A0A7Y3R7W4_9FLAO|nr:carboxypeptidase-like regulatory domain-containing protein [Flavobacterium sp. IMCC34852]NNT71471.1 carboxypeptidase regulatory-like domain-containing protein [Flavobacterium sp. IMCC34852]
MTLIFLLLFCCASQDDATPAYNISGSVYDDNNYGIPNIKVYYSDEAFVVTDAQGKFQIEAVNGEVNLTPQDPSYTFTPNAITISEESNGIIFYGEPVNDEIPNSTAVYEWFCQMQLANGLVETTENGNLVSLYDNALAALVFIAKGDRLKAEKIFNYFNGRISTELNAGTGGFAQFRNAAGVPNGPRWMGDNCWLLIALNNYEAKYNSTAYSNLQNHLETWIRSLQNPNGSLNAGYDDNGLINNQVTEGMIDAYNAILGYDTFHYQLLAFLEQDRWEASSQLLLAYPNNYHQFALDNFSWGYCAFENFPNSTLQNSEALFLTSKPVPTTGEIVTGFCFDIDRDTVWFEGTGEMVVAFQKAGMISQANYYLAQMEKGLVNSSLYPNTKGIPYVTNLGTGYGSGFLWTGADIKPHVSSSAWYLFGMLHFDPMAIGYSKNCPISDRFWVD